MFPVSQIEGRRRFIYETIIMENLKISLYIASCILLARITFCENVGHNNTLIGVFVESKLVPIVKSKQINSSNHSHWNILKSFQRESGLNDLINKALYLQNNSNQIQGIVSFLDKKESAILQDIAVGGKKIFMSFDLYHCNLASISINGKILNKGTKYDKEYLKAIKFTVEYLDLKKIAIMTTKHPFDAQFAQRLLLKLPSLKGQNTFYTKYEITDFPLSSREILKTLYEIQLHSFKAIIIIGTTETAQVIFKLASQYGMLGFEKVWMTIEFNEKQRLKTMPLKLINLVADHDMTIKWNVMDVTNVLEEVRKEIKSKNFTDVEALSLLMTKHNFTCKSKDGGFQVKSFHRNEDGRQIELFSWKESVGITISTKSTNELRLYKPGAFKQKINVVTIADKPFTSVANQYETGFKEVSCSEGILCEIPIVTNNKTYWNKTCCVGYSVDLLKLLENDLHFVPRVYIVEDGSYGSKTKGKWNGMVGDVYKGKAEMAAAGLTITNLRSQDVQFTSPFMRAPLGILMSTKKDPISFVNFKFLMYMTEELLWCLLATFFIGIVTVYTYENARSFFAPRGQKFNDDNAYKYVWKESFTYFSGLTFQRDLGGKNPKRPGARITAVVFAFTMVVVMTAYTAVLTASNVKQEERNPFKGMQDERLKNPTTAFKFGTVAATSIETFFREAPDPVFQRMNLFMKNYNVKTTKEGIQNVLDGRLEGFINEYPFLRYYITKQRDCLLRVIDLNIAHINYGFVLPKDSEWTEAISNAMLRYQEDGILAKLNKKWLSGSCTNAQNQTMMYESYALQYFGGLYLILFATCGIVVLLLIIEYSLEKCHGRDVWHCKWRRNKMIINQGNEEEMKEKTTDVYQVDETSN